MTPRDAFAEAMAAPTSRPGRTLLTALGTILGVGLLVLTLGLTASTTAAVNSDFNALISTEVDVTAPQEITSAILGQPLAGRVSRLHGLVAIGPLLQLPSTTVIGDYPMRATEPSQISALAASTGALTVIGPKLARGRIFDHSQEQLKAHVALIGSVAAKDLGMRNTRLPWWITVAGTPFLVEGIIASTQRHSEVLLSVVIPYATAPSVLSAGASSNATLIASTNLGYTDAVARALPSALYPQDPARLTAAGLPQPNQLRNQISSNLTALFVVLAVVGLVVGMIGITNAAVVSVVERIGEIGVRRALGARKGQIALQFLLENLIVGAIGGILGICLGVTTLTAIAFAKGWTPVLPLWVVLVAPVAGGLTGLLAGVYPAVRAANADPVHALAR